MCWALSGAWNCAVAQTVGLPTPRLLTMTPMGGQAGTEFDVTVTGENIEDSRELLFSTSHITARPKLDEKGQVVPQKFIVKVAADAPVSVHDARMMTRLGISSTRAFSISKLAEVVRTQPNTTLATAMELKIGSVCNATITSRAADYYAFEAKRNQQVAIDCAAVGIDSKLVPVVIVADAKGRDLMANRADGFISFQPPADGRYIVKVHGLTFQGGAEYFYRLAIMDSSTDRMVARQASTRRVSAFSWSSPSGEVAREDEGEPNDGKEQTKRIALPCRIQGSFAKAADVDTFEFQAKQGERWWVEVASERLGLLTDPFVLVQRLVREGDKVSWVDMTELQDIPSPMKVSSNGYSYDGPVYDAGSADVLGSIEIPEDGNYRLQLRDLFGGTRNDPRNVYELVVRKATPDFSLVGWAIHMELRNGDRAALSKPIALRGGATMAFEIVAIRKDGFDGDIDITMEDLPRGISACGLRIPAGKNKGILLISADADAATVYSVARIVGSATILGQYVTRSCALASTVWPVRDASQEIPNPRLLADVPVSATAAELAPLTVAARESKVWEAAEGQTLKIPLKLDWRCEFSGAVKLRAFGDGFETIKHIDVPLGAPEVEAVIELGTLKTKPGEYAIAFYGGAVAKYRDKLDELRKAEVDLKAAAERLAAATELVKRLTDQSASATPDQRVELDEDIKLANEKLRAAENENLVANKRVQSANAVAQPKDLVDIVVSEPIRLRVNPQTN